MFNLITYDMLSDKKKQELIEKYRDVEVQHDWYDYTYKQFQEICDNIGITDPKPSFTGFWSQGDGASFSGYYNYKKGALKWVKNNYPQDNELQGIVKGLQDLQRRYFYKLDCTVTTTGRYAHSGTMYIDKCSHENVEEDLLTLLCDLADWLYKQLETEYEYRISDENIINYIKEYVLEDLEDDGRDDVIDTQDFPEDIYFAVLPEDAMVTEGELAHQCIKQEYWQTAFTNEVVITDTDKPIRLFAITPEGYCRIMAGSHKGFLWQIASEFVDKTVKTNLPEGAPLIKIIALHADVLRKHREKFA